MNRTTAGCAAFSICLSLFACSRSEQPDPSTHQLPSHQAHALVQAVRAKFVVRAAPSPASDWIDTARSWEASVLGASAPGCCTASCRGLTLDVADMPAARVRARASVLLPLRARGAMRLTDARTGLWVEATLPGATDSAAEQSDGMVVYRNALSDGASAHVIYRVTAEGAEDYVLLESAPERSELRYGIVLSDAVAGLRIVSGSLELLDGGGAPRLRVSPPQVIGAGATPQSAVLSLEGCAADIDPAAPWGRKTVDPGARTCSLRVAWGSAIGQPEPGYPLLVDPSWSTTASMADKRHSHTAVLLGGGHVLVAGGRPDATQVHVSAELYDPHTDTFATTGVMSNGRASHGACLLDAGHVLVAGGLNSTGGTMASAEIYDASSGGWTTTGSMATARALHGLATLGTGEALAEGGESPGGVTASAELFDPTTGKWSGTQAMGVAREKHTSTVLVDGTVLVTGGENPAVLNSAQRYDRTSGGWSGAGTMVFARSNHTATLLSDGKVLLAGGGTQASKAERFDPVANSFVQVTSMAVARSLHTATLLGNDRVMVAGGYVTQHLSSAEVHDPGPSTWSGAGNMAQARSRHTATLLGNGAVLVAGGMAASGALSSAELFSLDAKGSSCTTAATCESGNCVDGVCCDTDCNALCMACSAASKGQGADGTCGQVALGLDPNDQCDVTGAGACASPGACDGTGSCVSMTGKDCASATCSDETTVALASQCSDKGVCVSQGAQDCRPYRCLNGSCPAACHDSTVCMTGSACIAGVCVAPGADGSPCASPLQCDSGLCVESVCCNDPCTGMCQTCRGAKKDSGYDGTCGLAKPGIACGPSQCAAGTQNGQLCTTAATCEYATSQCAPYVCADSHVCAVMCTHESDCIAGYFCDVDKCTQKLSQGEACAADNQCQLGHCVDLVCCENTCGGNLSDDCKGCSVAVGSSSNGICSLLDNTPCANGKCVAGICIEQEAGPDAAADAQPDALADGGKDSAADAPKEAEAGDAAHPSETGSDAVSERIDALADAVNDSREAAADGSAGPGPWPAAEEDKGGCGCRVIGQRAPASGSAALLAIFACLATLARRRFRRSHLRNCATVWPCIRVHWQQLR